MYIHAEKKEKIHTYLQNDERFQRERGVKIFFLECCYTPPGVLVPGPVPPADEQQSIWAAGLSGFIYLLNSQFMANLHPFF